MKRLIVAIAALIAIAVLTACTDEQVKLWLRWHADDPAAAEEFAGQQWVQESLATRDSDAPQFAELLTNTRWTVDWARIAQCESGSDWDHPPVSNRSGVYSGGLMWNHRYWPAYGGDFAPYPYQATMEQQIIASERLIDGSRARADDAWDCY